MFIPTRYEDLNKSTIVLGADILKALKKKDRDIEDLFQELRNIFNKDISLNQYFNTITFLWLIDAVKLEDFKIKLK